MWTKRRKTADQGPSRREKRQSLLAPGAVISAITPDARDPSLVHVRVGRRSAAKIDLDGPHGAIALGLRAGVELDQALINAVLSGQQRTDARYWAFRSLSRAGTSVGLLITKLQRKGIDARTAESVCRELEARGLLDDRRYAEVVVSAELRRKPAGARMLEIKLRSKRIDPKLAREVVERVLNDQAERHAERLDSQSSAHPQPPPTGRGLRGRLGSSGEARRELDRAGALKLAQRKVRTLGTRVDKLAASRRVYALLARRGFDPETCREVTREAVAGMSGPSRRNDVA